MLNKKRRILYRIIDLYYVGKRRITGKMIADTYRRLLYIKERK